MTKRAPEIRTGIAELLERTAPHVSLRDENRRVRARRLVLLCESIASFERGRDEARADESWCTCGEPLRAFENGKRHYCDPVWDE